MDIYSMSLRVYLVTAFRPESKRLQICQPVTLLSSRLVDCNSSLVLIGQAIQRLSFLFFSSARYSLTESMPFRV